MDSPGTLGFGFFVIAEHAGEDFVHNLFCGRWFSESNKAHNFWITIEINEEIGVAGGEMAKIESGCLDDDHAKSGLKGFLDMINKINKIVIGEK